MKKAVLLLALLPGLASAQQTNTMKLSIQVENRVLTANLIDSKTTRDFVSLLPLTLTMNDLFGREKWGATPAADLGGWNAGAELRRWRRDLLVSQRSRRDLLSP